MTKNPPPRLFRPLALAVAVVLGTAGTAWAKRLLSVEVQRDGQVVLKTAYDDDGRGDNATLWRYLGTPPLWAEDVRIEADASDPNAASLNGQLRVEFRHAGRPLVGVDLDRLRLTRTNKDLWFLPGDEVERTARLAGLPARPVPWLSPFVGWLMLGVILGLGGTFVLWVLRKKKPAEPR